MTPYELRFQIFESAKEVADRTFYTKIEEYERMKDYANLKPYDCPTYPSVEDIIELADKINEFVSSK